MFFRHSWHILIQFVLRNAALTAFSDGIGWSFGCYENWAFSRQHLLPNLKTRINFEHFDGKNILVWKHLGPSNGDWMFWMVPTRQIFHYSLWNEQQCRLLLFQYYSNFYFQLPFSFFIWLTNWYFIYKSLWPVLHSFWPAVRRIVNSKRRSSNCKNGVRHQMSY